MNKLFYLEYQVACWLLVLTIIIFISIECGKILTKPTGIIQSPGHPNIYPHGINCTWYIVVQPGYLISLIFRRFHLEFHYNCTNDYLEVYDTGSDTSLGRWDYFVFIFFHTKIFLLRWRMLKSTMLCYINQVS